MNFFFYSKNLFTKCECRSVRPLLSGMLSDLMARVHWPVRPKSSGTRLLCHWHPAPPVLCNTYFNKLINNAGRKPCIVGKYKGLNKGQKGVTSVHLDSATSVWVGRTSLPVPAIRPLCSDFWKWSLVKNRKKKKPIHLDSSTTSLIGSLTVKMKIISAQVMTW